MSWAMPPSSDVAHRGPNEKPSIILFRNQDLFLAQKIQVGLPAGTRIDDGRKVAGKIVGVTLVIQGGRKRNLQRNLRRPDEFSICPELTVNRGFTARGDCIEERLAVVSKNCSRGENPGKQGGAFPIGSGTS